MYDRELEKIIAKFDILEKAYDNIRLVDPAMKKVINIKDGTLFHSMVSCFGFFGKEMACENCIAMRAYLENDTFLKFEYNLEDFYLITAIPLRLSDRIVVLELIKKVTNSLSFNNKDVNNVQELHKMIDELNNQSLKDSLTGIYNRRYINEKLSVDLMNSNLVGSSISVIMADIDFFKNVNDNFGHLAGDYTLKVFATLLAQCLNREFDWVARYGGEEFLICLPGASASLARDLAENIRKQLEGTLIEYGEYQFSITASFGIGSLTPNKDSTIEEIIEAADKKLYDAKHNGRNRVEY